MMELNYSLGGKKNNRLIKIIRIVLCEFRFKFNYMNNKLLPINFNCDDENAFYKIPVQCT